MSISSTGENPIPSVQGSNKPAPEEHLGNFMGYDRTEEMKSGGLFILSSQEQCKEASTLTRIGHAVLGVAKVVAAIVFVGSGAWEAAQVFTLLSGLPGLALGCLLAPAGGGILAAGAAVYMGSPTAALGALLKSAYHDFKLAKTGKA